MVQDVFKVIQEISGCSDESIKEAKKKFLEEGFTESRAMFEAKCGTKQEVLRAMSIYYNIQSLSDTSNITISQRDIEIAGADNIFNLQFLPHRTEKRINILIVDPKMVMNIEDIIKERFNLPLRFIIIMDADFQNWLRQLGMDADRARLNSLLSDISIEFDTKKEEEDIADISDFDQVSVVNIVNRFIVDAVQKQASDIHIEPLDRVLRIRFRIDGILSTQAEIEKAIHKQLVNRIKVMSNLDSTNSMVPQSGKLHFVYKGKSIDARVSTLPGVNGETVTMRLISNMKIMTLEELGFKQQMAKRLRRLMAMTNGIILITGPTGSGKSSTLAAMISELNTVDKSIITIEDPVEYKITGITQTNVNNTIGLTFASVLREALRQDPDIIMIGEIRDSETAKIAISASNTGHLVLSTLHTNSAATSAIRLSEMGIEPFMVASTIRGIVNQKLVRVLCPHCKEEYIVDKDSDLYRHFKGDGELKAYRSVGCSKCHNIGYIGRTIILEFMEITPEVSKLILIGSDTQAIEEVAIKNGMVKAREYALSLVMDGITSVEEIDRVLSSGI